MLYASRRSVKYLMDMHGFTYVFWRGIGYVYADELADISAFL